MPQDEFLEEIEVLKSIYDDRISINESASDKTTQIAYRHDSELFTLFIDVPERYPADSPVVTISTTNQAVAQKTSAMDDVDHIIKEAEGNVVIFSIIEAVREHFSGLGITEQSICKDETVLMTEEADRRETDTIKCSTHFDIELEVFHGPTITEQKSSFQSHFAIVHSMDEVYRFRDLVYEDKKFARATHNIFAYRFTCPKTGIVHHDCDDDGETAAGSRLAETIRLMKVDNVAVIVSRWFGGILLGPDRFKFICNSARDLLESYGLGNGPNVIHHSSQATLVNKKQEKRR